MSSSSFPGDAASDIHVASNADIENLPVVAHSDPSVVKLLVAGFIAAAATWLILKLSYPFFIAPSPVSSGPGPTPPTDQEMALIVSAQYRNAMALMAIAGSLFAVVFSWSATAGRSVPFRMIRIAAAVVLGGAFGVAAGWCAQSLAALRAPFELGDLGRGALLQAVCWGLVFLGIVLALSLARRSLTEMASLVVRGAVAAVLTAAAFPLMAAIVGIFWPGGNGQGWIPESTADQLAWFVTAGICGALALAGQRRPRPRR